MNCSIVLITITTHGHGATASASKASGCLRQRCYWGVHGLLSRQEWRRRHAHLRNLTWLAPLLEKPVGPLARTSFSLHRSLSEELDDPQSYGYGALTTVSLALTELENPPSPSGSRGSSVPSWVDGQARSRRMIGPRETTAQVHPLLFSRTLLNNAVENHGVEVVIGKLERVGIEGGRVGSVGLEGGRIIDADAVVLALGPWSSKLELLSSLFRVYGLKDNAKPTL
ncbi:hypothetical protein L6164_027859 [Bauhinia variegata]|uniref:Uncharacterized protein n=1 Tax=Bauhinia variegata TaxID=167791 RepID=A0ACB9LUQ5_BAUVA|nr:hypothetical protein L6164_027859 [Bauhinia variegata]